MVGLDHGAGAAECRPGFDEVRIERPLGEELRALDLSGLLLEDLDEDPADDLPFPFRIRHPLEALDKRLPRPRETNVHPEIFPEEGPDLLRLAQPQQAVVHEDAGEPAPDRPVEQDGRNGGIDSPERPRITRLSPTVPRISETASRTKDFIVQLFAQRQTPNRKFSSILFPSAVDHLRVELETVEPLALRPRRPPPPVFSVEAVIRSLSADGRSGRRGSSSSASSSRRRRGRRPPPSGRSVRRNRTHACPNGSPRLPSASTMNWRP